MKKTITAEDIEEVLNSFPYTTEYLSNFRSNNTTDRFSLKDYNKVIKTLLDSFYPGYEYIIPWDARFYKVSTIGGTLIAPTHMLHKWHYNCKVITFNSLYPVSMMKLYGEGRLRFNVKEFGELYKALYLARTILKQQSTTHPRNILFLKVLINFTYGALNYTYNNDSNFIACNNPNLIPLDSYGTLDLLSRSEKDNIIYVDTDTVYLYEMTDLVKHQLDNLLKIQYEVEDVYKMMVLGKRQYLTVDVEGNISNHGIKDFKRDKYLSL